MKKLKNKFIWIIVLLLFFVIFFQLGYTYLSKGRDTSSYASVIKGKGTVNKLLLPAGEKKKLYVGDVLRTIGESSIMVIEWGDGSITRLAGNSQMIVNETFVSKDLGEIRLSFNLLNGKAWSNVIHFMGEDSYFKEYFNDIEAGVRGTVFNVDLVNEYIETMDHDVVLRDGVNEYIVSKDTPFSLVSLIPLDIKEFLSTIRDTSWTQLNTQFDKNYLKELEKEIQKKLDSNQFILFILELLSKKYRLLHELNHGQDFKKIESLISELTPQEREESYKAVMKKYQAYHVMTHQTVEMYKQRLLYKKALILLANSRNRDLLLQSSANDLKDIMRAKDYVLLPDIVGLLSEQKNELKRLGVDISRMIDFNFVSDDLKEIIARDLDTFKTLFGDVPDFKKLDFSDFLQKAGELQQGAESVIKDALNDVKDRIQSN